MPFWKLIVDALTGPVVNAALEAYREAKRAEVNEAALEARVKEAIEERIKEVAKTEISAKRDVLLAELNGNWWQRDWRGFVAVFAFLSYWYVIIAVPHLVLWGWLGSAIRFGEKGLDNLFWLAAIAMGGYIFRGAGSWQRG